MSQKMLLGVGAVLVAGLIGGAYYFNDYTVRTYYGPNKLKTEEQRSFFVRNGYFNEYHENGQLKRESYYVRGQQNGVETAYDAAGQKQWSITHKDGQKEGPAHLYPGKGTDIALTFKNNQLSGELEIDTIKLQFEENQKIVASTDFFGIQASANATQMCPYEELFDLITSANQKEKTQEQIQLVKNLFHCFAITDVAVKEASTNTSLTFKGNIHYPEMKEEAVFALNYTPDMLGDYFDDVILTTRQNQALTLTLDKETKKLVFALKTNDKVTNRQTILFEKGLATHLGKYIAFATKTADLSGKELEEQSDKLLSEIISLAKETISDITFSDAENYDDQGRLFSQSTGQFNIMKGYLSDASTAIYNQDKKAFIESHISDNSLTVNMRTPQTIKPVLSLKIKTSDSFKKDYVSLMESAWQLAETELRKNLGIGNTFGNSRLTAEKLGLRALTALLTGLSVEDLSLYDAEGNQLISVDLKYKGPQILTPDNFTPDILDGYVKVYTKGQEPKTYAIHQLIQNEDTVLQMMQEKNEAFTAIAKLYLEELNQMVEKGYPDFGMLNQPLRELLKNAADNSQHIGTVSYRYQANEALDLAAKYAIVIYSANMTRLAMNQKPLQPNELTLEDTGLISGSTPNGIELINTAIDDEGITLTIDFKSKPVCETALDILDLKATCSETGVLKDVFFSETGSGIRIKSSTAAQPVNHPTERPILQEELQEQAALPAIIAEITTDTSNYSLGNPDGKFVIIEFFDHQCGWCKRTNAALYEALAKPENKNIRWIPIDTPIFGEKSQEIARFVLAAGKQGKYAEMHHAVGVESDLNREKLIKMGQTLGLDTNKLVADADSDEIKNKLKANQEYATQLNINGVPMLIVNGQINRGALLGDNLNTALEEARTMK